MNKNQKFVFCKKIASRVGLSMSKKPTDLGLKYMLVNRENHKIVKCWDSIDAAFLEIKEFLKELK